ncbi:MAG TPA: F0F1 ATP synthase subunit delta [Nitrospiria bacterium]
MEWNWTTFILEILNFLVLVWLLKRFLYVPVLNIIAKRKSIVDKALSDSKTLREEANGLKNQYQERFSDWEKEKEALRGKFLEAMEREREERLVFFQKEIELERERSRVLDERRRGEWIRHTEEVAISQAGKFLSKLLSRMANPDLEKRMIGLFLEDLEHLSQEQTEALRVSLSKEKGKVSVLSRFPIDPEQQKAISHGLSILGGTRVVCTYSQDPHLVSGLRIGVGSWVLRANLLDEIKFFSEVPNPEGSSSHET